MRIKDQYTIIKIGSVNKEREQAALSEITRPVVAIDLRPGKPWVVVKPGQKEEDIPKLTGYHAVAKPNVTNMDYPPGYLVLLPLFFSHMWERGSVLPIMDVNAIREFEFPTPPPPKEEIEKLDKLMISIRKLIEHRNHANKLMDDMHRAIAHRVVVEGKPLKWEGTEPKAEPQTRHTFEVQVIGCTREQAEQVLRERLGHDEDYGFGYTLNW